MDWNLYNNLRSVLVYIAFVLLWKKFLRRGHCSVMYSRLRQVLRVKKQGELYLKEGL